MSRPIPARLKKEPLLEAVWELRFSGDPAAGNVLPGFFYQALSSKFPRIVRLPLMDAPATLIEAAPEFWFSPKLRLEGEGKAIQVGHRVITLNFLRPYPGWAEFASQIRNLLRLAREARVVQRPERFSFKYVNFLGETGASWEESLNLDLRLDGWDLNSGAVQLRAQSRSGDFTHSCLIAFPVTVERPELAGTRGAILELETISTLDPADPWSHADSQLDAAHIECKKMFFGLLREETVMALGPEYEP